jgi:hydroxymethylglutaryl-CoA lyase
MMRVPAAVTVVEVGPRDGLQNEAAPIATADKVRFIDALSRAGHHVIEVSSFVSPARVPQLADAEAVFAAIERRPGVRYTALVPNRKGLDRALAARVDEVAVFASATERFSQANLGHSIAESLARYEDVTAGARAAGLRVRGYVSCAFGCPFEGPVAIDAVRRVTHALLAAGVYEVAVSDTIGIAHPGQVATVMDELLRDTAAGVLALHFHDTRGTALANVLAGLDRGITTFDASAGGLGGCPFAPGAAGNLATEDLLYVLDGLGIVTGVDRHGVADASRGIAAHLDHPLRSRLLQAEGAGGGR